MICHAVILISWNHVLTSSIVPGTRLYNWPSTLYYDCSELKTGVHKWCPVAVSLTLEQVYSMKLATTQLHFQEPQLHGTGAVLRAGFKRVTLALQNLSCWPRMYFLRQARSQICNKDSSRNHCSACTPGTDKTAQKLQQTICICGSASVGGTIHESVCECAKCRPRVRGAESCSKLLFLHFCGLRNDADSSLMTYWSLTHHFIWAIMCNQHLVQTALQPIIYPQFSQTWTRTHLKSTRIRD